MNFNSRKLYLCLCLYLVVSNSLNQKNPIYLITFSIILSFSIHQAIIKYVLRVALENLTCYQQIFCYLSIHRNKVPYLCIHMFFKRMKEMTEMFRM